MQQPSSPLRQTQVLQNSLKQKQTKISPILALLLALAVIACEREQRRFTEIAPLSGRPRPQANTELRPGTPGAPGAQSKTSVPAPMAKTPGLVDLLSNFFAGDRCSRDRDFSSARARSRHAGSGSGTATGAGTPDCLDGSQLRRSYGGGVVDVPGGQCNHRP